MVSLNDSLNEREFELVNIIGGRLSSNQRDLSRQMNLSLGMTNMLLRRLVAKGYIRIQQLNRRKVHYLLTPKGFAEKMNKSIKYTLKTINSISLIKARLGVILSELFQQDPQEFWILGTSDLAMLIEIACKELGRPARFHYIKEYTGEPATGVFLICREDVHMISTPSLKVVNIIHELSKDGLLISRGEKEI